MAFDKNKYKDLFCAEAEEQVGILSQTLLALEKNPNNLEYYKVLMRSAHTIKGAAATMEYTGVAELSHVLEDVFHAAERGALTINSSAISSLLSISDHLNESIISIKDNNIELNEQEHIQLG